MKANIFFLVPGVCGDFMLKDGSKFMKERYPVLRFLSGSLMAYLLSCIRSEV